MATVKRIESRSVRADNGMVITATADDQKRILVPQARPGQIYAVRENADGSLTLTVVRREIASPTCRIEKEQGFTVAVPEQPIDEAAIKELLADFP
jgi:hypothetical protein